MRFHEKFHSRNHHTDVTAEYPDSATDPIASPDAPFQGDFHSNGDIFAKSLSLTEPISSLEIDTILINNSIPSLSIGVLTLTTGFSPNTDGTNLINVDADTIGGITTANFENTTNKNQPNGYAGLDGSGDIDGSVIPDTLNSIVTLNFVNINDYLTTSDLSSSVAPLVGGLIPESFIPPLVDVEIQEAIIHTGSEIGFFSKTPTIKQGPLTPSLDDVDTGSLILSSSNDYTFDISFGRFGFDTLEQAETLVLLIQNLQDRVNELETTLSSYGLL